MREFVSKNEMDPFSFNCKAFSLNAIFIFTLDNTFSAFKPIYSTVNLFQFEWIFSEFMTYGDQQQQKNHFFNCIQQIVYVLFSWAFG